MAEKTNFAWPVTSINNEDYKQLMKCVINNASVFSCKTIAIFGAGIRGTEFSILLCKNGYSDIVFTDNNKEKWYGCINDYTIVPPDTIITDYKKYVIIISIENGYAVANQLKQAGLSENIDFFYICTDLYSKYMIKFNRNCNEKYLIMGDCEFTTISLKDKKKENLGEIIEAALGEHNTKVLAMHGMGLRAHYNAFSTQILLGMTPEIIVIMINFDTLTGKQHLLPRSQHVELIKQMMISANGKNEELNEYYELVNKRFNNVNTEFFTGEKKGKNDINQAARLYFMLNYMYKLNIDTEGIIYLRKMILLAHSNGIDVLPFIPPVNYMFAEQVLGDDFRVRYEQNVSKVRSILKEYMLNILDLSFAFTSDKFAEENTPDETLNYEGRIKASNMIIEKIREIENERKDN